MKSHKAKQEWNIIFLIYAELADSATIHEHQDDYRVDVKADLAKLKSTILKISLADNFNVFTVENIVKIKNDAIVSDSTFISLLVFDQARKKNKQKQLLKPSTCQNFLQNGKDIKRVFKYVDRFYSAKKNLLITWDHGSAFGIFKKVLPGHPTIPPITTPGVSSPLAPGEPPIITPGGPSIIIPIGSPPTEPPIANSSPQLLQNTIPHFADNTFEFLSKRITNKGGIITFVRNNLFNKPNSFFETFMNEEFKEDNVGDFVLLSNDILAKAIRRGFRKKRVDVLMMFNCDMQNMHTCYSFRKSVKYLVAPEGAMTSPGYDYVKIARLISDNKDIGTNGKKVAVEAVNTFKGNYIKKHKAEAFDEIALFAVCLTRYEDEIIKLMRHFIKVFKSRIPQDTQLVKKLAFVRENCYAFAANLDYFLVDLINFMQDINQNFDDAQLKRLEEKMRVAAKSIVIGSAIGDSVYSDGPESLEQKNNRTPTGISIYYPPRLQDPSTPVVKNFMVPNAPFSTSLLKALKWEAFLCKLYKTPVLNNSPQT